MELGIGNFPLMVIKNAYKKDNMIKVHVGTFLRDKKQRGTEYREYGMVKRKQRFMPKKLCLAISQTTGHQTNGT